MLTCQKFRGDRCTCLKDCPDIRDVWKMFIQPKHWPIFFSGNFTDWILFNSKNEIGKLNNSNWKLTFGEATRRIWLKRNAWIFWQEEFDVANLYWRIILAVREFKENVETLHFSNTSRREIQVRWSLLAEGWVKCNVNGSSRGDGTLVNYGGVICEARGNWICDFSMNLGKLDSLSTKVRSFIVGLEVAWNEGLWRVQLETYSIEALALSNHEYSTEHPLVNLVVKINELLNRD